ESRHYAEVKETLSFFDDLSLDFTPGSQYQYSTLGYNLLAILIEELSGKRYADYMAEAIFRPLGMDQTYPDPGADLSQADAHLYYLNKGKLKWDRRPIDGSYKLAGAGFRSTSEDLVKMMVGYQNGFISPGVRETMFTSGLLADGEATHVGLGWRLNRDIHDRPTIEHAGSWQGARTVVVHYPAEDLSLAIMINTQCVLFIEETAHLIADQFLSKTGGTPSVSKPAQPLTVRNTGYDGSVTTHTGELALTEGAPGILFMDMDSDWLRQNPVYPLGTAQDHALSTPYGLLYLQLDFTQQPLGKLYQYQVLGDPFHMRQQPTLTLQASQ
ncbi:MAG TPA: hypothetical protein DCE41_30805, partial [Cytophagales bacterium]|nr:hypothetical protein [Cytophagales bacterium]